MFRLEKIKLTVCTALFFTRFAFGQNAESDLVLNRIEFIAGEEYNAQQDYSELYDELEYYLQTPININEEAYILNDLGLINSSQFKSIKRYIKQNGEIGVIYELQAIEELDKNSIQRIAPFIAFKNNHPLSTPSSNPIKNSLIIRSQTILEKQKGFKDEKSFTGNRSKNYLRLRTKLNRKVLFGLALENDIGESIKLDNAYYAFDHYSFFIRKTFNNKCKIVVGDYLVNFGQGLTKWSGAGRGKSSEVLQIKKVGRKIRESSSANESNYLRGLALEVNKKKVEYAFFLSHKTIDAKLSEDGNKIMSFPSTGYHRTKSELEARNNGIQQNYGGLFSLQMGKHKSGLAFVNQKKMIKQREGQQSSEAAQLMKLSQFRYSLFYDLNTNLFNLFGEIALNQKNDLSIASGILMALHKNLSLAIQGRYSKSAAEDDQSSTFSESGKSGNEFGLYSSIDLKLSENVNFSAYRDIFEFPQSKYQVSAPSKGFENMYLIQFDFRHSTAVIFRYKTEHKEKDMEIDASKVKVVGSVKKNSFRMELRQTVSELISLKTRFETNIYKEEASKSEKGLMLLQDVKFRSQNKKTGIDFRFSIFNTSSYNNRIYAYENDVLYAFSVPAYSGNGIHNYLLFQYKLTANIKIWLRYGRTTYFDRKTIGSGLNEIAGNSKNEIKGQLRLNF